MAEKTVNTSECVSEDLEQLCEAVPAAVERLRSMKNALTGLLKPIYSVTTPTAVSEELLRAVFQAAAEDGEVGVLAVEVHQVRVQMQDGQFHVSSPPSGPS